MKRLLIISFLFAALSGCNSIDIETEIFNPDSILPKDYLGRTNQLLGSITTSSRNVKISVWDHSELDGDIVSVYVNGKLIIDEKVLGGPSNKISLDYTLDYKGYNYILLYAHNMGSIPPNTCTISVSDGINNRSIVVRSDLKTNGSIDLVVQ
jgi:hypothetical protein